jgi:hypothetical protein
VSGYTSPVCRRFGTLECCSTSCWSLRKVVLSGGALRERVGRCRGRREVHLFGGGERKVESNRFLLGERPGRLSLSASSASFSISVSRVTITGRLTGFFRPKVKPVFMDGYRGIGETNTVRSVIVVHDVEEETRNQAIFIDSFSFICLPPFLPIINIASFISSCLRLRPVLLLRPEGVARRRETSKTKPRFSNAV